MSQISLNIEPTNTPTILKFTTNKILTSGSYQFNNIDDAKNSPLAQQLFYLPFIQRVYISANFIALERFSIVEWEDVQNEIKEQLENYLNSGNPIILEEKKQNQFPLEVYAEVTPNPSVLKFVTNKKLVTTNFEFKTNEEAKASPLATELFNFPFTKEVFLSENYVAITKIDAIEWNDITVELRSFIKQFIDQGKSIINEVPVHRENQAITETPVEELDDVSQQIVSILNEHIKPAVAADGGNIKFQSYIEETKTVNVILQGACSGCPSSTITLKNGIEAMLKQLIPGKIEEVVAINF
ncbi:MAG: NifU family protein [Lutibacter sp.]|uniref:NifU family protein n=1 Tax=Lutibacter sp. TaxID=1925666 RepID=UPI00299CF8C1|nr:NifU family protein [Lutibacter sp.]MDX1830360.1 NifU family protein [Lutibacter sp.]